MDDPDFVHVECPRDSWQGFSRFVPTAQKIEYLLAPLEAGFTHLSIDVGGFGLTTIQTSSQGQVLKPLKSGYFGVLDDFWQ